MGGKQIENDTGSTPGSFVVFNHPTHPTKNQTAPRFEPSRLGSGSGRGGGGTSYGRSPGLGDLHRGGRLRERRLRELNEGTRSPDDGAGTSSP